MKKTRKEMQKLIENGDIKTIFRNWKSIPTPLQKDFINPIIDLLEIEKSNSVPIAEKNYSKILCIIKIFELIDGVDDLAVKKAIVYKIAEKDVELSDRVQKALLWELTQGFKEYKEVCKSWQDETIKDIFELFTNVNQERFIQNIWQSALPEIQNKYFKDFIGKINYFSNRRGFIERTAEIAIDNNFEQLKELYIDKDTGKIESEDFSDYVWDIMSLKIQSKYFMEVLSQVDQKTYLLEETARVCYRKQF